MRKATLQRSLSALTCLALLFTLAGTALASAGSRSIQADYTDIKVALDGEYLVLTDAAGKGVEPFAVAGTTYLPVRAVAGALSLSVDWAAASSTVVLTTGGDKTTQTTLSPAAGTTGARTLKADYADIKVTLDGKELALADANGELVEPFAVAGTTYLPVRAVADALGLYVSWDADTHTVVLSSEPFAITPEEAAALVQGNLDSLYLGKYDPEYLSMVGLSAEEAEQSYLSGLEIEAEYFASYWGILSEARKITYADLPETLRAEISDLYKEIYSHAKYTVSPAEAQEDGSYVVTVKVSPIDVIKRADTAYTAKSYAPLKTFLAGYTQSRVNAMSDANYMTFITQYAEHIVGLVKAQLADAGYLAEESVALHVVRGEDGAFRINEEDWAKIDAAIVTYPA